MWCNHDNAYETSGESELFESDCELQSRRLSLVDGEGQIQLKKMAISDVVWFLKQNGIPSEFCENFRGKEMYD